MKLIKDKVAKLSFVALLVTVTAAMFTHQLHLLMVKSASCIYAYAYNSLV